VTWYLLEQRYVDADLRAQVRPRHLEYLHGLAGDGTLVAAGPLATGEGSLTVYDVPDEDAARALLAADPYTTGGVTELLSLREWNAVVRRVE
jgi:uncharacterized protein YciI